MIGNVPRLRDDGAWRRLAADRHDKGSGVTGALMPRVSALRRAPDSKALPSASGKPGRLAFRLQCRGRLSAVAFLRHRDRQSGRLAKAKETAMSDQASHEQAKIGAAMAKGEAPFDLAKARSESAKAKSNCRYQFRWFPRSAGHNRGGGLWAAPRFLFLAGLGYNSAAIARRPDRLHPLA